MLKNKTKNFSGYNIHTEQSILSDITVDLEQRFCIVSLADKKSEHLFG